MSADLRRVAELLRERNRLETELAALIKRPPSTGHLGEWIASQVFGIDLLPAANHATIDGVFTGAPREGATVNVKCYLKREGILDMSAVHAPDYYIVLAGPASRAASSFGGTRPFLITSVHLFEAATLREELTSLGRRIGTATSVRKHYWESSEVYPRHDERLPLTVQQRELLALFAGDEPRDRE